MFIGISIYIDSRKVDYDYMISNRRLYVSFKINDNSKKLTIHYDDNIYDDIKVETGNYDFKHGYLEMDLEKNKINFFEFSLCANYKYYVKLVYEYVNGNHKKEDLIKRLQALYDLNKEDDVLDRIKVLEEMKLDDKFLYYEVDKLTEDILMNDYYDKLCEKMDDYDFLNIITDSITSSKPYSIDQEKLNDLVLVAKAHEYASENIWRLAMTYDEMGYDYSKIEEYFVSCKDVYYLGEYISGVYQKNLDYIIDLVIKTNDKEYIKKVLDNDFIKRDLSEEQKQKLNNIL
jgi:hypothetical protein